MSRSANSAFAEQHDLSESREELKPEQLDMQALADPSRTHSQAQAHEFVRLPQRARARRPGLEPREQLEHSLRNALRQKERVEQELRESLERERAARVLSEASDAFKEAFLSILGHDLLNPLHTMLTTARLMKMRREIPSETQGRLSRIISSGERMQRMIAQIQDLTRARLNSGRMLTKQAEHDLVVLVTKIIHQLEENAPGHRVQLLADASCKALVDQERIEQVVSNLIGNAMTHGDPDRPIHVTLEESEEAATLCVHNFGPPIDPELLPMIFEPFKGKHMPRGRSAGLGIGLYISERIITAHGGTIDVRSSPESGTCFRVRLPSR